LQFFCSDKNSDKEEDDEDEDEDEDEESDISNNYFNQDDDRNNIQFCSNFTQPSTTKNVSF
jgi:hypothetical protein